MIYLSILSAPVGLIFWTSLAFIILLVLLKKFAWKPILKTLKERDDFIEKSIKSAEEAKAEMSNLKAQNEELLAEARLEREKILKEAKEMQDSIIAEAKKTATQESDRMIANARVEIEKEKSNAMSEIKSQVANLSLEISEKILKSELSDKAKQSEIIELHLKEAQLS